MAVSDKRRSTLLATVGVLVALVALNTAAWFLLRGGRVDVTEEKLYTVSPGVGTLVASLPEPVRLDFYWTREQGTDLPAIRAYAQRVQEFLEEIVAASDGMLELRVIDPEPFSETEDMARAAGIAPRTLDATGRTLMLGLAVRGPTDKTETIPWLDPSQEPFLEYEIARRVLSVGRDKKPAVAVLSTIPEETPFNPRNPMARGGKSVLFQQLDLLYDLKRVDRAAPVVPAEAEALVVIQPRGLNEAALKAIDAWAVAGKPLIVFADPWCEMDPEARTLDMGSTGAGTSYDLGPLLAQWGVDIDAQNAVADLGYATRQILNAVKGVHALVIETNHDETLLQNDTKRPWSVKQRILSRHGHLSNQAAAKLVAEIATENLRHILLAHLSEDCNTPDLAREAIRQNLPPALPTPEIHCPGTPPHPIPHTIRIGPSAV